MLTTQFMLLYSTLYLGIGFNFVAQIDEILTDEKDKAGTMLSRFMVVTFWPITGFILLFFGFKKK